jgi:hypothetical protein
MRVSYYRGPARVEVPVGIVPESRLGGSAAAFGTRKPMLITSTIIVLPLAMVLIILSLVPSLAS